VDNVVNRKIPVIFQKLFTLQDSRFTKVKIWLMHLEENYNGSYFSKEVVTNAIPSVANTPILGYIESKDDDKDFSDHRMIIVKEKNGVKVKYIGQAYGVIPESNNAQFEKRVGDDGIEREYLTVEGVLWNKWDESTDIMNRDGEKAQSMELHDEFSGSWSKDTGLFHFSEFKFFGACILGEGITPAMNSASIEVENTFSMVDFEKEVQNQMEEFKLVYSRYQKSVEDSDINFNKEGDNMDEKLKELLAKYSLTEEAIKEKGFNLEEYSTEEDLDAKLQEYASQTSFSLSAEQFQQELRNQLKSVEETANDDGYSWTYRKYWYSDHLPESNVVIAQDASNGWTLVGLPYSVSNDKVTVDFNSAKRYKIQYVPMEIEDNVESAFVSKEYSDLQKSQYESEKEIVTNELKTLKENFALIENEKEDYKTKFESFNIDATELEELKQFKASKIAQERQEKENELFSQFSEQLTEEEVMPVKEIASTMSIEDIQEKLFSLVGKKLTKFSKDTEDKKANKIPVDNMTSAVKKSVAPYDNILEKYFTQSE
jgi:hypothetical protein